MPNQSSTLKVHRDWKPLFQWTGAVNKIVWNACGTLFYVEINNIHI